MREDTNGGRRLEVGRGQASEGDTMSEHEPIDTPSEQAEVDE